MYETVVGNIGIVYYGTDQFEAMNLFGLFVERSLYGTGRAKGEPVTILRDGNIVREYLGSNGELN